MNSLVVPGSLADIGSQAFAGCSNMTELYFGKDIDIAHDKVLTNILDGHSNDLVVYGPTGVGSVKTELEALFEGDIKYLNYNKSICFETEQVNGEHVITGLKDHC